MVSVRMRRLVSGMLILTVGVWAGCAGGGRMLDKEDLVDPEPADFYEVTTRTGEVLTFISLHVEGDLLKGRARFTSTEEEGSGEEATTSVSNVYEDLTLEWEEVVSVKAIGGRTSDSGFLLAGGALVVGVVAFLLLAGGSDEPVEDNGKGGP